jgi:hypothetical protein
LSTKHDRVQAALELREPDRVPTLCVPQEYANVYEILGKKPIPLGFLMTNPYTSKIVDRLSPLLNTLGVMDSEMDKLAYDMAGAAVKLDYDAVWIEYVPVWRFRNSKVLEDIYGRYYDIVLDHDGNLTTPLYRGGMITSPADWQAWDKRSILRMPEKANRVFSGVMKDYGDRIAIFSSFFYGLFENTWQPMGFERFAVAVRKDRDFLRRIIKFYEDHYCLMVQALADAGVPYILYGDDMAYRSGPMLNPKMMEELYGDSLRRITETAHSLGMKIVIHSDGNLYPLLEWYADCGVDGVQSLEPTAGMELAKAKEMAGDRLCLIGNVDITHILVDADKDEVFEAVRKSIQDAGSGGGYIISPTNTHPGMDPERMRWMKEAAEEYGSYPLGL